MKTKFVLVLLATSLHCIAQNVGINTTNPTEKLDVNGNINVAGTLKLNGVQGAPGQVLQSTGSGLSWGSLYNYKNCQMYYTAGAGSFVVPAGVTEVMIEAWGGGGGYDDNVGGTSGSYARRVQTVSPNYVINFTVGAGAGNRGAGGNTTVTVPEGTLTALGGGAVTGSTQYGQNMINPAGSLPAFYMPGNRGEVRRYVYGQRSSTVYTQTTYLGSGGAPVGMINTSKVEGTVIYYENGTSLWAVTNAASSQLPSSGGTYPYNSAAGMVIFWW